MFLGGVGTTALLMCLPELIGRGSWIVPAALFCSLLFFGALFALGWRLRRSDKAPGCVSDLPAEGKVFLCERDVRRRAIF